VYFVIVSVDKRSLCLCLSWNAVLTGPTCC